MSKVLSQLARQQSRLFKVNYAPDYRTFIPKYVISDPSHPLNEAQKRRAKERVKEGLWWHATTGAELSKSSCVRGWARRRMRTAMVEELKARGYDENGKVTDVKYSESGDSMKNGKLVDLKGSLRLHAQAPLIPAKFVEVKAEVGKIIDIMVEAVKLEPDGPAAVRKLNSRSQSSPPPQARTKKPHNG